jgi:hypothetical protein
MSGSTTGLLGDIRLDTGSYSPRHLMDCIAGTTILYHPHIYRWTQSLSVMTTGLPGLLEYGHRRSIRWGSRTFQGLRARQSS